MASAPGGEAPGNSRMRRYLPVAATVGVGIICWIAAFVVVLRLEAGVALSELDAQATSQSLVLEQAVAERTDLLASLQAYFDAADGKIGRDGFAAMAAALAMRRTGAAALEWIPRVPASERAVFQDLARREGASAFEIHDRDEEGRLTPAAARSESYPVLYAVPAPGNEREVGYDFASQTDRRTAIERARDSGHLAATKAIRLLPQKNAGKSVLILAPVYRPGMRHESVEERRAAFAGVFAGTFPIAGFIDAILARRIKTVGLERLLIDTSAAPADRLLDFAGTPERSAQEHALSEDQLRREIHWESTFPVADRTWAVAFVPTRPVGITTLSWNAIGALVEGAAMTGMIVLYQLLSIRRTEQLEELNRELANASRIVQNSPTILYRIGPGPSLPLVYVSSNIELYGHSRQELLASPGRWRELIHPDDAPGVSADIGSILAGETENFEREIRWQRRDGSYVWFDARLQALRGSARRLVALEGIFFDITERKVAGDKIAELARTDSLTGLPNRSAFVERLSAAFSAITRGAAPFAVVYLDLDHFKDVNDVHGHPVGDQLLQAVALRLKSCVRATDLVARFGGDEFAVLQADVNDGLATATLAGKVIESVSAPYMIEGNEAHVTTSTGISLYNATVSGPEAMMRQADLALYRAKEEGRNRFCFHSADLDKEVRERVTLADELRVALKTGELELYYQPQVESASGRIVGLEALIRWNHPTRGMLSPGLFIPIAERTGLILPLGRWVAEEACRQLRQWQDQGIAAPCLSVNASAVQFKSTSDFERELVESILKWGISPGDFELELTESVLMEHTEKQDNPIERLRKLGVKIAIDDFGTGYSSLDYLSVYPITRLKIAQELISKSMDDSKNTAIVRAAIGLARDLGVDVIAEGVETQQQLDFLADAGCANVQGYYYSTPVKVADMTELLRKGTMAAKSEDEAPPTARLA